MSVTEEASRLYLTPSQIDSELARLTQRLESETEDFASVALKESAAEVSYKVAWAKAFVTAEGRSVEERKAQADLLTEDQLLAAKLADAELKAKRELLNTLRSGIEAVRTLAANFRANAE